MPKSARPVAHPVASWQNSPGPAGPRKRSSRREKRDPLSPAQLAERDRLVRENYGLVNWMVTRLQAYPEVRQLGREDAVGVAQLALLNAAARYDPGRGVRFSTYASIAIRNDVLHAACQSGSAHWPEYVRRLPEGDPRRVDAERVRRSCRLPAGDVLPAGFASREEPRLSEIDAAIVREALERLPERELVVLYGRFWEKRTLRDLGALLGITPEWVRQIERMALEHLQPHLQGLLHS